MAKAEKGSLRHIIYDKARSRSELGQTRSFTWVEDPNSLSHRTTSQGFHREPGIEPVHFLTGYPPCS